MKSYKFLTFGIAVLFLVITSSCTVEEKDYVFSISGVITNPQQGKVILSQLENINRKKTRVIGEIQIDSEGKFTNKFDLEPHIYEIDFYGKEKIMLAIDQGQDIKIKADGNNLKNIEISGSPDTVKLQDYEKFRNESLERLVKSVRKEIADLQAQNDPTNAEKIETLGKAEIDNYEKHRSELNAFIKKNMGNSIAIYPTTLRWDSEENIPLYEEIAKSFTKERPNLEVTKRINEKVGLIKNTSVGGKVKEINMPDKEGANIALSEIKGKYILIDFWASWCGPCRRESKKLTALYQTYKDQGFEIYGVSLDTDRNKWIEALEKDNRTWANVSTLKGFETPASFEYGVTALPAKFLIDGDGNIIAKNLHGDELKDKIDSLFSQK